MTWSGRLPSVGTARRLLRPPGTALALLVPAAEPLVAAWRGDGRPIDPGQLPLHVTLVWPFLPQRRLRPVLGDLATLVARTPAFDFALTRVGRFPGVVYLAPEPVAPFAELVSRLGARWPRWQPYAGRYAEVVPHLTVALGPRADAADVTALEAGLPVAARAAEVVVGVQRADGSWRVERQLPLGH